MLFTHLEHDEVFGNAERIHREHESPVDFRTAQKPPPMSTAKNQTHNIDLGETEFPCLGAKEFRNAKGKRHAAEALLRRQLATRATITKTLEDPNNLLGKRRKARLLSESADSMVFGVQYSLNRKGRWQTADAQHLLSGRQPEGVDVDVVEQAMNGRKTLATAVHCLNDDGSISSAHAKKSTSNEKNLKEVASKQRKNSRRSARNSKSDKNAEDSENEELENARIAYNILKLHSNTTSARKMFNKENRRKGRRAGAFRIECDDNATASEMEASIHDDTYTYKPSRDFRFCLADYMKSPDEIVLLRKGSIDEIRAEPEVSVENEIVHVDVSARPCDLLDISAVVRTDAFFESVIVSTQDWQGFSFAEQIDSLGESFAVRWLDADRRRVAIDATKMLLSERELYDRQQLIIVLERMRKNNMRLVVNTVFPAPAVFDLESVVANDSLISIIDSVCSNVKFWKAEHPIVTLPETSSRFESRRTLFASTVNSVLLAQPANVIDQLKMAELLRKETEFALDTFERLSSDDWSDVDDGDLDIELVGDAKKQPSPGQKVTCVSCSTINPDELYEMDEWWQCRQCLRQLIINQIRIRNVPFHIPLVCLDGQSPFDVLPSLLPLPLIAFYTKMAAIEVLCDSTEEIGDLTDCPGCRQTAHVLRPNEFNTCFCSVCGVHWCAGCRREPHFPMNCEQHAIWAEKFDKQFASDSMRDEIDQFIKKITCDCGEVIECGDKSTKAGCRRCFLEFNPQTMKLTRGRASNIARKERPMELDFSFREMENVTPVRLINKQFSEMCTEARLLRFSESKSNDFERKARKAKDITPNADKLKELRKAVLCLVENGFAWLYVIRNRGNLSAPKAALTGLQKQLTDITNELDNNVKGDLTAKVDALEAYFHKAIETIRKAL